MATNRISDSNNVMDTHNQLTKQTLDNGNQVNAHAFNAADNASQRQVNNMVRGEANAMKADAIQEFQAQLQLQKQARNTVTAGI
ncbi:MAG: hypothetical protein AAFU79_21910 [Myxococcota bacterium]